MCGDVWPDWQAAARLPGLIDMLHQQCHEQLSCRARFGTSCGTGAAWRALSQMHSKGTSTGQYGRCRAECERHLAIQPRAPRRHALVDDGTTSQHSAARLKPRSEPKSRVSVDVKFEHVGENVDAADTEAVSYDRMILYYFTTTDGSGGCPCVASASRVTPERGAGSRLIENLSQK